MSSRARTRGSMGSVLKEQFFAVGGVRSCVGAQFIAPAGASYEVQRAQ
jgi:hypothetical protein